MDPDNQASSSRMPLRTRIVWWADMICGALILALCLVTGIQLVRPHPVGRHGDFWIVFALLIFVPTGLLFLLAARGFRIRASWRWVVQALALTAVGMLLWAGLSEG